MLDLAHVHPMLVHFPIVLFLIAVAAQFVVLQGSGDLSARQCVPMIGLGALVLGALAAIAAAVFGDIALDQALELGFPEAPLEVHETLGMTTMWIFTTLAAIELWAWWARYPLQGGHGWLLFAVAVVGAGVMLTTAYHGGALVYQTGVNVAPVGP
jgi:uncharacterized membrane protein